MVRAARTAENCSEFVLTLLRVKHAVVAVVAVVAVAAVVAVRNKIASKFS